ncbi:MAG: hypothetical protein GXP08_07750 [Gammaproteobacteria bacterium]|nr:hypothetical protein [Gammaproteobacteria bacterium]
MAFHTTNLHFIPKWLYDNLPIYRINVVLQGQAIPLFRATTLHETGGTVSKQVMAIGYL